MKTIICPTDFSPAAINAVEYAAKLAQKIKAELKILHVQLVAPVDLLGSYDTLVEEKDSSELILKKTCKEIGEAYNISCMPEVETTNKSFVKILAEKSAEDNLIVMGTNGVDDIYQYFFGTNTYDTIEKVSCSVLIVPEGVSYKDINTVVYAWDYNTKSKLSLTQFSDLIKLFDPEIILLHVSQNKTQVSRDVFKALREAVDSKWGDEYNISFEQIFSNDIEESIDNYMIESAADLLAITYYDRGVFRNLFHGKIAKKLCEEANYPLLVMHI